MAMRRAAVAISMGVVLVVGLAPASLGDTSRFRAVGCTDNPRFDPTVRRISRGDRIVWKNRASCTHTVHAYGRGWSKATTLSPGERTAKKFRRRGTYKFRCLIAGHSNLSEGVCSGMCGRVRVRR